jgi:MFS family permease
MAIASGVMLLIVLSQSPAIFVLGFAFYGLAQAFIGPAFSSLLSKAVPKGSLGITWGVFMTALGVMAIPAPILGGWIYEQAAPEVTFFVAACFTLVAIPLVLLKLRTPASASAEMVTSQD